MEEVHFKLMQPLTQLPSLTRRSMRQQCQQDLPF
jgi:hypothetical protein